MTERETLLAEIAEKQARLAELDAPDPLLIEAMARGMALGAGAYEWPELHWPAYVDDAQAALAAIEAAGFVVVPRWPSAMELREIASMWAFGCGVRSGEGLPVPPAIAETEGQQP